MSTKPTAPGTIYVELTTGCDECHENCQDDGYGASDCCGAPLL